MKPALIALLGLIAVSPAFSQSRNPAADPSNTAPCSISGLVVKLQGTVPLPASTVRLQSVNDRSHTFSGVTDSGGHFELRGIEPGRYRLRVIRNGYVTQEYGQRTPMDPGAILSLRPGQDFKDLLFRLSPAGVISGRIQNQNSEPLPWVRVSALRASFQRGKRTLSTEVTVLTNDLGEYRLFGLRPGRYFLSATYKPGQKFEDAADEGDAEDTGKSGYVPTYYPGSTDPSKAISIPIKLGEDISSIDLLLEPTAVYSVRGHVNNLPGHRDANGAMLILEPRSTGLGWTVAPRQTIVSKPDGLFEFPDILPGSYILTCFWFEEGKRYQARQFVEVTTLDAEGIQLTLAGGIDIRGQLSWDPKPGLDNGVMTVMVRLADTAFQYGAQARVPLGGAFVLRDVSDGLYRLTTNGQTQDSYLKSIRYGGMEVSDDEFNVVRGAQATLEVTLSSHGARVQGKVTDADGVPAVGVWVVLVPDEAHRNQFRLYKQRTTDQAGSFDFRGIAPGDYKLFSWEEVESNTWQDPEFLKPFEQKGQTISLREDSNKSVNVVAIRSASQEQEKQ